MNIFRLILLIFTCLIPFSGYCHLNGTYIIGQSPSNYATFTAAVNALTTQGIDGPVVFNVKPGTYNEQILIPSINGSSAINSITFQSLNSDSTSVILSYTPNSSTNNYTIKLNGAKYITFREMTLSSTGSISYSRVIEFIYSSRFLTFSNNRITGSMINSGDNLSAALIYCDQNPTGYDSCLIFTANVILNGSYGILMQDIGAVDDNKGLYISCNDFQNQYNACIKLERQNRPRIINNSLVSGSANVDLQLIGLYYCVGNFLIENNILNHINGKGICLSGNYYVFPIPAISGLVINNFITTGGGGCGIYLSSTVNSKLYNNSVVLAGDTNLNGKALFLYNVNGSVDIRNNILSNFSKGYAFYTNYIGNYISDHNCLYTNGPYIGYYQTIPIPDLATWKVYSGWDIYSLFVSPVFNSFTDLHENYITLMNAGIPLPEVQTDIDGEPRNTIMPDIGADEVTTFQTDASIAGSSPEILCAGPVNLNILLRNNGTDTLHSVTIHWSIDNVPHADVYWSGTLSANDSILVFLGTITIAPDSSYLYTVWLTNPNDTADLNTGNDSLNKTIYTTLDGTYTIASSGGDYPDFTSAVNDLIIRGVCSPVTFRVLPGTYNEQISVPPIAGSSAVNTITFQSYSGDSSSVILTYDPTISGKNYTVELNAVQNIIFSNMTLISSGVVVHFSPFSNFFEFSNNQIISSSNIAAVIYSEGSYSFRDSSMKFISNLISNGSYGIHVRYWGTSLTRRGIFLKGNNFMSQYFGGIKLEQQISPVISNNSILTNSAYALYCFYCNNSTIEANRIIMTNNDGTGIYLSGNSSNNSILKNNFVSIGNYGKGIYLTYVSNIKLYNNSVVVADGSTNGHALYICNTANNIDVMNNIFYCKSNGYAIYTEASTAYSGDFNCLFSNGPDLAYYGTSPVHDLQEWKNISGMDSASVSVSPVFPSPTDPYESYVTSLNAGTLLPEVQTDIDGESRSATMPDIGADEVAPLPNDAGITNILPAQFCSGLNDIYVKLRNNGLDILYSVDIAWEFDDTLKPVVPWSGMLNPGETAIVTIGTIDMVNDSSHQVTAWTNNPNGIPDMVAINDTSAVTIHAALGGSFTIGGTGSDYPDISSAVSDLEAKGICSPVVFNILPGTYNEAIIIPAIVGSSSVNTITFRSSTGDSTDVTLTRDNTPLQLQGVCNITFEKMTFSSTGTSYSRVIDIGNTSIHVYFCNNRITACPSTYANENNSLVTSDSNFVFLDTTIVFQSNLFQNGSCALLFSGNASPQTNYQGGLIIINNTFQDQFYRGINLNYQAHTVISGNNIIVSNSITSYKAIYCNHCTDSFRICNNKIYLTGNGTGIHLYRCNSYINNRFNNVYNNFINVGNGTGIYIDYSYFINTIYNSVISHSDQTSGSALYISYYGGMLNVKNNILANEGTGYAILTYSNSYSNLSCDYNDLYTNGTMLGHIEYPDSDYPQLDDWISGTTKDSNSVSISPSFTSNDDLHENFLTYMNAGTPVSYITEDIDGEIRHPVHPDIGADEKFPYIADAGITAINIPAIYCTQPEEIKVALKNFGMDTLNNAYIYWSVNDSIYPPLYWSGMLSPGYIDTIILDTFMFVHGNNYDISAWVSNPNGMSDCDNSNDTSFRQTNIQALIGTYSIGQDSTYNYNSFSSALADLVNYGVCGSVIFFVADGIYTEQILVPEISNISSVNTVTFQSESNDSSAVILTFSPANSSNNFTIQLNGAKYITFKKITISTGGFDYSRIVYIRNGAGHNSFISDRFIGATGLISSGNKEIIFSPPNAANVNSHNTFYNNLFFNGSIGISLSGTGTNLETGLEITDNVFLNQYSGGMNLNYQDAPLIQGNVISTNSGYQSYNALYCSYCDNGIHIIKNNIKCPGNNGKGITFVSCDGTLSAKGVLANNFISMGGGSFGIYYSHSFYQECCYNTTRISGSNINGSAVKISISSYISIKNNIFSTFSGSPAVNMDVTSGITCNNNGYYSNGTIMGIASGNNCLNLLEWQNATGYDSESIYVLPVFYSSSDLHCYSPELNNAGIPVAEITDDIDGESRNTLTPDIGADEFKPFGLGPDTILCAGNILILDAGTGFDSYLWSNGMTDEFISVDSSGTGLNQILYTVTVTLNGDTLIDSVFVTFEICSQIDKYDNNLQILIYPNPVSDYLNVKMDCQPDNDLIVEFYSIDGQLFFNRELRYCDLEKMDVRNFSPGIYYIRITGQNFIIVKKIIKL